MKILITFALDFEFAPWRSLRPFAKILNSKMTAYKGSLKDAEVLIALTGVGGVNAQKVARTAFEWKPDFCISSGLAGSLHNDLSIGQVFAAREVVELESGRSFPVEPELLRAAQMRGATLIEKLLTSTDMVLSAEGKSRLGRMGEAVEMESFAILREAAARGVPAVAIRAISDAADETLPLNFETMLDESGNVNFAKTAKAVARAPQKLPALVRLAKNSRVAAKNLAEFLDNYVMSLAAASRDSMQLAGAKHA